MFGLNEGMAIFAGGCIGCHIFAMLACLVAEFSVRIFSSTENFALLVGGGYCWREKRVCDYAVWKTRKSQSMGIVWRKDVAPHRLAGGAVRCLLASSLLVGVRSLR